MASAVGTAAAAPLIDRWPSVGWDYLRRGGVTTTSGTPEQRRDGHDAYLLGMATLDPDLTLAHLSARSADLDLDAIERIRQGDGVIANESEWNSHLRFRQANKGLFESPARGLELAQVRAVANG